MAHKLMPLIIAFGGAICLLGATVNASIIDPSYTGPVVIKMQNYGVASVYRLGSSAVGDGNVNALPEQTPPAGAMTIPSGPYAGQTEDAWFIFKVTSIETPSTQQLWTSGQGGLELVGMAYGGVDVAVGLSGLAFLVDGLRVDLYTQSAGTFDASLGAFQGTAGRTGYSTYTGITGGTLFFSADAVPGIGIDDLKMFDPGTFGGALPPFSQRAMLGRTDLYLDVNNAVGTAGAMFLPTPKSDPFGGLANADLYAISTVINNDGKTVPLVGNWGFIGNDPVRGYVPEPATLGLLAFGAVVILRRRRAA